MQAISEVDNAPPKQESTVLQAAASTVQNAVQSIKDTVTSSSETNTGSKVAEALALSKHSPNQLVWEKVPDKADHAPTVPDVAVVAEVKPEGKPVVPKTRTGLGAIPAEARKVMDELEVMEHKVVVPEETGKPAFIQPKEEPVIPQIPDEHTHTQHGGLAKPSDTPVVRPTTPPPRLHAVDVSTPPRSPDPVTPKKSTDQAPATQSGFSTTTGTSSTMSTPKPTPFPTRSEPPSPAKNSVKDSLKGTRTKRHSLICKIKHMLSPGK